MMQSFRDTKNQLWEVAITVATVKRCRVALGVDLYSLAGDGMRGLADLLSDPVRLVDLLYVIVRDQAEQRGITDEQFGESMAGDSLGSAAEAFVEALIDFFPNGQGREAIRRALAAARRAQGKMLEKALAKLDQLDSSDSFSGLPDVSESTPEHGRSAS